MANDNGQEQGKRALKIRMCLDGTEENKLIYKIKSDKQEIADTLMI